MHQICSKCGKRKITNDSDYCFECRRKKAMSKNSNYAPEGEHYCQNGDCSGRGKSFKASKMIKLGKYFVCCKKCEEKFKERYTVYEAETDN